MKKRLKEIFRPERENIAASALLYTVGGVVPNPIFSTESFFSHGLPLPIYRLTGVAQSMPPQPTYEFWIPAIIFNAIIWYIIGSSAVEIYLNKVKGDQ